MATAPSSALRLEPTKPGGGDEVTVAGAKAGKHGKGNAVVIDAGMEATKQEAEGESIGTEHRVIKKRLMRTAEEVKAKLA